MYKAFLIDQDDTLTRHPNNGTHHVGSHAALTAILTGLGRANDVPSFADWAQVHHTLYEAGDCFFTAAADRYGFDRHDFFALMHEHVPEDDIIYDRDSVQFLNSIAGRAVIFTDAARAWAERRAGQLGHGLTIFARDDDKALFARKQHPSERWARALANLSALVGQELQPADVLMIDDSASVLAHARTLGFATAHCHFGFPERNHTTEFDHSIRSVGELAALVDG